ncbi:DeoR/GlpR transcriptional regulator [Paenibacillus antri]|uniref:DeoR/GlpR transcriptional regulator n=1 Tax=Paenibacillus antri TaxID=2582848 RepID=A0A5R9G6T4_9BACL|nr:DeoR/GlpR family DNA-binding transcription regulator [Paenibacillus antri]TLS48463.1 DeoR/GlpR transcriptional regulator [Paenibacillus antri]
MEHRLNDRQSSIVEQLRSRGEVKISELKQRFDVTEMTVRRDLEKLERLGIAARTFGGAILDSRDIELAQRTTVRSEEKGRIGKRAAACVRPGDSIFIDGGSTTFQVARHLPEKADITVVTNALNVANELASKKIPTIVVGGLLLEATISMVGPTAVESISKMAFDKAFLGATGLDARHGFSNSNLLEADVKRMAIRKAKAAFVVLDHSKFGEKVLVSFAALGDVGTVVTDRTPDPELSEACRAAGVDVLLA